VLYSWCFPSNNIHSVHNFTENSLRRYVVVLMTRIRCKLDQRREIEVGSTQRIDRMMSDIELHQGVRRKIGSRNAIIAALNDLRLRVLFRRSTSFRGVSLLIDNSSNGFNRPHWPRAVHLTPTASYWYYLLWGLAYKDLSTHLYT